ncbi:MAG TPA: bifunctional DNA primase/polymerase, partial [Salinarimonas sp.]|nr:bifunctional DNA primase/polymerase [Salinarimonas sp.]
MNLDAALGYVARGWAVFPLGVRSKLPLIPKSEGGRGFKDASTDPAQVRTWWNREPQANVGLACGKVSGAVVVIDIDNKLPVIDLEKLEPGQSLVSGMDAWPSVLELVGGVPVTLEQVTGGGGRQLFYRLPEGRAIRNFNRGLLLPDGRIAAIDVKTDGGYVLLPPSIHPETGRAYAWLDEGAVLAPCPGALLDLIFPPEPARAPSPYRPPPIGHESDRERRAALSLLRLACQDIASAKTGRHELLFNKARKMGGYVGGGSLDEDTAVAELVAAGLACGKTEAEVRRTVADAIRKGKEAPLYPELRDTAEFPRRGPPPEQAPWPDDGDYLEPARVTAGGAPARATDGQAGRWAADGATRERAQRYLDTHPNASHAEIADAAGVPKGTVSNWFRRGVLQRREGAPPGGAPPPSGAPPSGPPGGAPPPSGGGGDRGEADTGEDDDPDPVEVLRNVLAAVTAAPDDQKADALRPLFEPAYQEALAEWRLGDPGEGDYELFQLRKAFKGAAKAMDALE